ICDKITGGSGRIVKNPLKRAESDRNEMSVTNKGVGEVVRLRLDSLSPAERRLARVLLASYPIAGLESVARFAERAGVSPPTVTRFITKLGFHGYPEFQESLRHEVQARLSSPLTRDRERACRWRPWMQRDPVHRPMALARLCVFAPGPGHERGNGRAFRLVGGRDGGRGGAYRRGAAEVGAEG